MGTATRQRPRSVLRYMAMGLPPSTVAPLMEWVEEQGAAVLRVEHDDEGSALVCFELAAWDTGAWLRTVSQRFGCGLAPASGG